MTKHVMLANEHRALEVLAAMTVLAGLCFSVVFSYNLFHGLAEVFSSVVAFGIFAIAWNTRRFLPNDYLKVIGVGYLFCGFVDLLHTFAYEGMNVFVGYEPQLTMQLWNVARYVQAATLLGAAFFIQRRIGDRTLWAACLASTFLLLAAVFSGHFPDCFIAGTGLTPFKIVSEYVIAGAFLVALIVFYRQRSRFDSRVFRLITLSLMLAVASELMFTLLTTMHDRIHMIGHLLKLAEFYFMYQAIIVIGLNTPFDLIFRDLKLTEQALIRSQDSLEEKVRERTAELRASEEKYRALIQKVQAAIVLHDGQGRILTSNPLAQALLGLSEEQLLDKALIDPDWHFLREDGSVAPVDEYPVSKVLSSRLPLRSQVLGISHPDRRDATWVLVNAEPDYDETGKISLVVVSFVDITEQRSAQRQLEILNLAVNTSNDAMFVMNDDTLRFVYVNETACRSLGYSREELLTMAPPDIDPDVTQEIALEMRHAMLSDRSLHKFETRHRARDGKVFPVELSGSMFEYEGNVFGLSVVRDISERKEAEQQLRVREQAFRGLVENSPDVIVRYDREGRRTYVNPEFERVNRLSAQEILGKKPTELSTELTPMAAVFTEKLMAAMAAGTVAKIDLSWMKDGRPICWYIRVVPEFDANGEVVSALTIWSDISERKQAEAEIRKLNESLEQRVAERTLQLEASNKELEAFCYSVSHDLRAPLRHIDGYVDLLVSRCRDGLNDKGLHYVDTIAASARRMGVLIDDLLQFSRTGRAELHSESLDMNQALQEVLAPLQDTHTEHNIEWVIGKLPSVLGDYALLRQVWANLLENAVKFTRLRKDARIEVSGREEKGETVFVVADNGVGFDMSYVDKLFGVFQRLHSQEEFEGTGIGLATVQRIVTRHGGRIWAEGKVDGGATFHFSIPSGREV